MIQRQQKTFVHWASDRNNLVVIVPLFIELFQNSCARVVTLHTIMALVASGEKFEELHPEAKSPGILFMANIEPNKQSSQFFISPP